MEKLTKRQQEVLDYIISHQAETGFPPTRQEIASHMGFKSPNAAEEHLRALDRKKAIEILSGTSRGIRVIGNPADKGIPLIGQVAAGNPILAEQNIEDYREVPPNTFKPNADFFLRVKGDSMQDIGILDNDLLAVHTTKVAESGQVIVARVGDDVTVKRYKPMKTKILLLPENEEYEAIEINPKKEEFSIEGLAVGILRTNI